MRQERIDLAEATLGYLDPEDGPFLNELALHCPGPYLEVGSYCGKSTIWIGDAAETNDTFLASVDHHRGSPEMAADQDCYKPEVIDEDGTHDTLPIFRRTMRAAGLVDTVLPIIAPSAAAFRIWSTWLGFVFIDGAHDYDVQFDADHWSQWVMPGGIMAFHDTTIWVIEQAVKSLLHNGWHEKQGCRTIRVLQKS